MSVFSLLSTDPGTLLELIENLAERCEKDPEFCKRLALAIERTGAACENSITALEEERSARRRQSSS